MATVDELNFRLIIDDSEFNKKVEEVLETANDLNATLSDILDLKKNASSLSSQEFQTLKRLAELESQRKINSEKEALAAERRAAAMEREALATEALKQKQAEALNTQQQIDAEKIAQATQETALAYQKVGTEVQRTATEAKKTEQAQKRAAQEGEKAAQAAAKTALAQQKVTTETQKTAAEAQKTAAAAQKVATENQRTATEAQRTAAAHKKIATEAAKAATEVEKQKLLQQKAQTEAERTSLTHLRIRQAIDQENTGLRKQSQIWMQLKNLSTAYFSVLGATRLVSALVRTTAEFELQRTTLGAILQDVEKANVLYEQMKELAVKSPFNFKELATYAKQLSAYSIPVNELYDTTKMLADVSAGLGVGMDRLVLAYGQIRSASFLRGQEVRQLTEAGIPILEELRKQFVALGEEGITVGDVFDKISRRMVPFEMVAKVFKDMTSEGGKFYQMQEVQSETLRGKLSNLKDAYQIMFSEIGEKQDGLLKGSVNFLRSLAENYEKIGKALTSLIAIYGIYRATLLATQLVEMAMVQAHLGKVSLLRGMGAVVEMLTKKSKAYLAVQTAIKRVGNPYVFLIAGVAAAAAGYLALAHSMEEGARGAKNFNEYLEKQNELFDENAEKAREFIETARNADKTYDDRIRAVRELVRIYPELLRHYKDEQDILDNILTLNKSLESIELTRRFEADNARLASLRESLRKAEEAIEANRTGWGAQAVPAIQEQVKELKKEIQLLEEEMSTYDAPFFNGPTLGDTYKQLNGWRKAIADILNEVSSHSISLGLSFNSKNIDTNSLDDVIKDVQNRMKEVTESRANAVGIEDDAVIASYDTQLRYLEKINQVLKGRASVEQKTNKERAKSQEQKDLETKIDLLKKLQSAYEKLQDYATDTQMPDLLSKFFSSSKVADKDKIIQTLDFRKQLIDAAIELEKYDKEAAEKLRSSIGYDESLDRADEFLAEAKKREAALKAQAALADYLKSWNVGDETEGSGSTFKITKIVSDYQKALDALGDKRDEATKKLNDWIEAEKESGNVVDENTKAEKENAIATTYQAAATNLLNKATEDVRKTAGDYLDEWAKANNIDISNWSHKTIYELNKIQRSLNGFDASNLPKEIIDALNRAGIDIEKFKDAIKGLAEETANHAEELADEKRWDYTLQSASALVGLFEKIAEYAEAAGNSGLLAFANGFASSFRTMGDIAEKVAKQDYIGAIISGVTSVASSFLDAAKNAAELERNIRKGKLSAEELRLQLALGKDTNSIFGDDKLKSISNAWEAASEKFKAASEDIAKAKEKLSGGSDNDSNGWGAAGGAAAGAGLGFALGTFIPVIGNAIGAGLGALIGAAVGLVTGGLTDIAKETDNFQKSLEEMAKELDAPLINEETGLFNIDTLQLILDTYDQLDATSKEVIEKMIAHTQEYESALEQLTSGMKDVFGEVADDIASKFIEAFKVSGEAALDYADIIDDVAVSLAQMVLKSMLIERVFKDDLAGDIAKKIASGQMDEALAMVDSAMQEAQALAPAFQEFLEGIQQYFNMGGSDESLSGGIKGITEDTANLLASYLNAIRADVSFNKTQIATISTDIKQILGLLPASPTLNDYLNQIQANTFDTAQSNREILSRIDSVLGLGNEGSALRVITT